MYQRFWINEVQIYEGSELLLPFLTLLLLGGAVGGSNLLQDKGPPLLGACTPPHSLGLLSFLPQWSCIFPGWELGFWSRDMAWDTSRSLLVQLQ